MPNSHRLREINGPLLNSKEWMDGGARTATSGGGKKPPKKPPTKTGGLPDKPYDWEPNPKPLNPNDPNNKKRWK